MSAAITVIVSKGIFGLIRSAISGLSMLSGALGDIGLDLHLEDPLAYVQQTLDFMFAGFECVTQWAESTGVATSVVTALNTYSSAANAKPPAADTSFDRARAAFDRQRTRVQIGQQLGGAVDGLTSGRFDLNIGKTSDELFGSQAGDEIMGCLESRFPPYAGLQVTSG